MYNSSVFNCSLFSDNFPDLATEVAKACEHVGMKGLDNIKLPWNQAKNFANKTGALYNQMADLVLNIGTSKNEEYRNIHASMIQDVLVQQHGFINFYKMLKYVNNLFERNRGNINRVAYELYAGRI